MGFILSKFRKKKTTSEKLEDIDQRIKNIEKFQEETEQQFRRVVGKLVVSSILIYIIALVVYYYYYSPETFKDNIIKFLPLLVFPIVTMLSRRLLTWYYKRKLSKNETTLKTLKTDKKKLLDEVMDTETYKKAKEILEKYAPDQLGKDITKLAINSPLKAIMPATPAKHETTTRQRLTGATPVDKTFSYLSRQQPAFQAVPNTPSTLAQPKLSLPRPILPRDRGTFDKLIDLIIGDGPGNRYALICRVCSAHNGMALKHEFEYLAFRCAYCLQWNPARKQKPHAPNLLSDSGSQDDSEGNDSEADTIDTISKTNSPLSNLETKNSHNDLVLLPEKVADTGIERIEEETDSIMEANKTESSEESLLLQEIPNYDDDRNVPVSTAKIDLSDLHQALEEIDEDISSSNTPILDIGSMPILDTKKGEPMDCSS